ncbi:MAG: hypothetical protein Q8R36_00735 [bacterium]|nr:hypothetical protein [bacterium]
MQFIYYLLQDLFSALYNAYPVRLVFVSSIFIVIASFFDFNSFTLSLSSLLFFIGSGDSSGGSGSGGGGGGSDRGADPAGQSPGEEGASCGCSNGASGPGGGPSTPFLCVWDGKNFVFENDFMFGKPTSLFQSAQKGKYAYENKTITPDLYRIQNDIALKDGHFVAQMKEIEPEESYLDHISLLRVVYPRDAELIVGSKFEKIYSFGKNALLKREGVEYQTTTLNGIDVASFIGNTNYLWSNVGDTDGYFMNTNDGIVEIKGRVLDPHKDLYLLLRAHYRDWTLGEIFSARKNGYYIPIRELFGDSFSPKTLVKGTALVLSIILLSAITAVGSLFRTMPQQGQVIDDARTLASAFGISRAYADTPPPPGGGGGGGGGSPWRSLVVDYWNGNSFKLIDVFSPRYYQPSLNAVAIPKEAIQKNGDVSIRVTATKRHKVHSAILVAPNKKVSCRTQKFSVAKAFHNRERKDYAEVLNKQYSGEYMRTIPADVVDVSFKVGDSKLSESEQEAYILQTGGIYTVADEETQKEAGDWVNKLDSESQSVLRELYALRTYHETDRKAVLL